MGAQRLRDAARERCNHDHDPLYVACWECLLDVYFEMEFWNEEEE